MSPKTAKGQRTHKHTTPSAAGLAASENDIAPEGELEDTKDHVHITDEGFKESENAGHAVPEQHGYSRDRDKLLKRLRRLEGQVRGVQRMVEEDRYCIDVVTQITAIQAALDKVALELLEDHTQHCIIGAEDNMNQEERTEELMATVRRLLRHG